MPVDLRKPLFTIYSKHAQGIVKKAGRRWLEYDLFNDPEFHIPYPFEMGGQYYRDALRKKGPGRQAGDTYMFGELTWPKAKEYLEGMDVALLPVGSIEQHGLHLPLDTDAYDADYLARQVAAACSKPRPIVLPLIPYGVSYHHDDFPGTISINNETLTRLVYEVGVSSARNGIKKLVIINGHGGNGPSLNFAAQMINRDSKIFVCVDSGETSDVDIYDLVETPNDVHAGEVETSTSLAVRPHLVEMGKARPEVPGFSIRYLNFTSKRGISWYAYTDRLSETGVMGDPTRATAEKGRKMWQIMIAHLASLVEELKRLTLDEIYQRRY
jgi:creatinine amidohydrolase/Fe(II)-dependent formamide hydrolase-like protein